MSAWTFHLPPDGDPERGVLVRDGFCWSAALFGPLWALAHRNWPLVALLSLGFVALVFIDEALGIWTALALWLLAAWLLGLEAGSLRRWWLSQRGWREAGVIAARNRREAETRLLLQGEAAPQTSETPPEAPPKALVNAPRVAAPLPGVMNLGGRV